MTDTKTDDRAVIIVDMDDPYVSSLIKEEFGLYRSDKWRLVDARENGVDVQAEIGQAKHVFRWGEYENLDWDAIAAGKMSTMWYMNRSGLIRKAQMAASIANHVSKCTQHHEDEDQDDTDDDTTDEEEFINDSDDDAGSGAATSTDEAEDDEDESEPETSQASSSGGEPEQSEGEDCNSPADSDAAVAFEDESQDDDHDDDGAVYTMPTDKCILTTNVPETYYFEVTDPDELDELLICDLPEVAEMGNYTEEENRKAGRVWILKPSLTNQAKSIVVIPTLDKLREVFEDEDALTIRQWVIQRYISNPLLISGGRKFHIRCHIFAVGSLTVYFSTRMLALFSLLPYNLCDSEAPDAMHLTNVCYQKGKFVASNPSAPFDERMAVLLMEEALSIWALEHLYLRDTCWDELFELHHTAAKQLNREETESEDDIKENIQSVLSGSRAAFKHFAKCAGVDVNQTCGSEEARRKQANSIAMFALNHLQNQIQRILGELYAGCMGVHHVPPFIPSLTRNNATSESSEADKALELEAKETLKRSSGSIHMSAYRPLRNTSELYGIDFMVDDTFRVYLLEVNAGPDFGQTGARLRAAVCRPMVRGMTEIITHHLFPEHKRRCESPFAESARIVYEAINKKSSSEAAPKSEAQADQSAAHASEELRERLVTLEVERLYGAEDVITFNNVAKVDRKLAFELINAELAWLEGFDTLNPDAQLFGNYTKGGVAINLTQRPGGFLSPAVAHFLPVLHIDYNIPQD